MSCYKNNCFQSFQTLSSFKKYLQKKYIFETHMDETESCNEFLISKYINTSDVRMTSVDNISDNIIDELEISNNKIFDFNKSIEQLHLFVVQFSLSLHNNNIFVEVMF